MTDEQKKEHSEAIENGNGARSAMPAPLSRRRLACRQNQDQVASPCTNANRRRTGMGQHRPGD